MRHYQELVRSLNAVVWEADAETWRFSFVSEHAQELLGYPIQQWLDEPDFWQNHLHPEDRDRAVQECRRALQDLKPLDMEYRMIAADGRAVWVRDSATVIAKGAAPLKLRGVIRDITERRILERELESRERRLNSFFTSAPAGLAILDAQLRFLQINDTLARMHGLTAEEHRGKTVREVLPKLAPVIHPILCKVLRTGEPALNFEASGETPSQPGVQRHWVASYFPIDVAEGKVSSMGAIVVEVTEQKRAEEALRASEARHRRFFERNLAGTFQSTLGGALLDCNESFARILGYTSRQEVLAHPAGDFYFRPSNRQDFIRRLQHEKALSNLEKCLRRKDGSPVWLLENVSLVEPGDGTRAVIEGTVIDITERKRVEEELRQLSGRLLVLRDEEQRRIAQQLHETTGQSLVALLMNLAQINRSAAALDAETRAILSESLALVKHCTAEVRTLSYLLHPPMLDEIGLVSALHWLATGFTQRSRIRVDLETPPNFERLPQEMEVTLFRIVQECLTNIHRHSGSATAKIRVHRDSTTLVLEVADQGRGMETELLRGGTETRPILGVGIAGMRERVKQLGGHLELLSGNHGTTVRATLPLSTGTS